MFPKEPQGEYSDLYEEVASRHYDVQSVFGTPAPRPTFRPRPRANAPKNFVVEHKKKRSFVRPGETASAPRAEGEPLTAANLFKPKF